MKTPTLTHLQFFALMLVAETPHSGKYIRSRFNEIGETQSLPAFYQFMSRLEDRCFLSGWYETFVVDGQTIKERKYQTTSKGIQEVNRSREFYSVDLGRSEHDWMAAI